MGLQLCLLMRPNNPEKLKIAARSVDITAIVFRIFAIEMLSVEQLVSLMMLAPQSIRLSPGPNCSDRASMDQGLFLNHDDLEFGVAGMEEEPPNVQPGVLKRPMNSLLRLHSESCKN